MTKFLLFLSVVLSSVFYSVQLSADDITPEDITPEEMDRFCTGFANLAHHIASKREAGQDVEEEVIGLSAQIFSDAADGKVAESVAIQMFSSINLAAQPEAGSADEVARWVYHNCMTTDWIDAN